MWSGHSNGGINRTRAHRSEPGTHASGATTRVTNQVEARFRGISEGGDRPGDGPPEARWPGPSGGLDPPVNLDGTAPAENMGGCTPTTGPSSASPRSWRSIVPKWLRHGLLVFLVLLVVEYLVIPELVGASKNLHLLSKLNIGWLVAGIVLEAGAIVCYALLTRTLLPGGGPGLFTLVRIVLATTAVAHVIPGGAAGGAGVGYRLLTSNGVEGTDAGFAMATEAIGSAVVLNVMLWLALLISIPLAGLHPIYVVTALVGLLALFGAAALAYTLTRGGERAVRVVRSVGRRIPRVGADRLERLVRQVGDSVVHLAQDRALLKRAVLWAGLNWLLDAASLWSFVTAFGHFVDPIELFAAYGIANVLGAIPITPGGLGVIEASGRHLARLVRRDQEHRHPGRARLAPRELLAPDPDRRRGLHLAPSPPRRRPASPAPGARRHGGRGQATRPGARGRPDGRGRDALREPEAGPAVVERTRGPTAVCGPGRGRLP